MQTSSLVRRLGALMTLAAVATSCGGGAADTAAPEAERRVLVFSKTAGFRHDSIPDGIAAIRALGLANGFAVDATEDASQFSTSALSRYQAVVFLSTTGDVLNTEQEAAFQAYIRRGGGFVGVHAAADTEYGWPWYGQLVGAWFLSHPPTQAASVRVSTVQHPSTQGLPNPWQRVDEWYDFQSNPSAVAQVLLTVDESSYQGGKMGAAHPISWARNFDGGRSWYTAMGHTRESFADENFKRHLLGGIRWAAGWAP
jgi:cytochrome c